MDAVGSTVTITEDMQSKYGNLYMVRPQRQQDQRRPEGGALQ